MHDVFLFIVTLVWDLVWRLGSSIGGLCSMGIGLAGLDTTPVYMRRMSQKAFRESPCSLCYSVMVRVSPLGSTKGIMEP
jgi:hypothetical protein